MYVLSIIYIQILITNLFSNCIFLKMFKAINYSCIHSLQGLLNR